MQRSKIPTSLWADWPFFLAAWRAQSLTGGARAMGVEQSTMSRRIARLESALGQELFHRTPEGLVPTELATQILPEVERCERGVVEAFNVATGHDVGVAGRVRVTAPESLAFAVLTPALVALQQRQPGLRLSVQTGTDVADLVRREADIGVRTVPADRPELVGRKVARYHTALFARRDVAERCADLPPARWPWIGVDGVFIDLAEGRWHERHAAEALLTSDSYQVRFRAALDGLGVALLPRPWARQEPSLVAMDGGLPPGPVCDLYLVTHRALRRVPRVELVWEALREACAALGEG